MAYDYFITNASDNLKSKETFLSGLTGSAYTLGLTVGSIILAISIIGIGFTLATGGAKMKAETKEHLGRLLIGGIVLFSITSILDIIFVFASGLVL